MNKIYLPISIVLLALILLVSSCSSKPVATQKSTTWTWQPTRVV